MLKANLKVQISTVSFNQMEKRKKIIRMTAHSRTLTLLKGQIGYLAKHYDLLLVAKDSGGFKEFAESEGVKYRDIDIKREISITSDIKSLFSLYNLFRKEKPDIVHANTPKGALLGMVAAKLAGIKHRIYNVNGLRFETATGKLRKLLILMEKIACACATKIIPQSNGVADVLRREKITKKPLKVIHNGSGNGVDIEYFNPEIPEIIKEAKDIRNNFDGINFVFVGRLVGDKGVNELVEAFDRLSKENYNVQLYLVGGKEQDLDPIKSETLLTIEENPSIFAVGTQKDVRPYLKASDVFILPSYREGFPNVVLEALSMGLPVIVSDVNGGPDAVKDNFNGFVIPKKNQEALYEKMKLLASDPELRMTLAKNGRPFVIEKFNRPDLWKATLEMYNNL